LNSYFSIKKKIFRCTCKSRNFTPRNRSSNIP